MVSSGDCFPNMWQPAHTECWFSVCDDDRSPFLDLGGWHETEVTLISSKIAVAVYHTAALQSVIR